MLPLPPVTGRVPRSAAPVACDRRSPERAHVGSRFLNAGDHTEETRKASPVCRRLSRGAQAAATLTRTPTLLACAGRGWAHSAAAPQGNPGCHRAANLCCRNNDVIGFKMGGFTGNTVHANNTDDFLPA